jgi:hypothetical protein
MDEKKDSHLLDAHEELVETIDIIVLASNQYCIVENPFDKKTGLPRYGC